MTTVTSATRHGPVHTLRPVTDFRPGRCGASVRFQRGPGRLGSGRRTAVDGSESALNFLTIGHRGIMGVEPENTLRSFVAAEQAGLDMIELDLRLSKDGDLVVMHDATVDRTTN